MSAENPITQTAVDAAVADALSAIASAADLAALKAAPAVCDGRIYDSVPADAVFPYATLGGGDTVGDDNACFDASEVNVSIHVWSRAVGFPECKAIAALVRARCRVEFDLSEDGFTVVNAEHVTTRFLRDPDGLTSHAAVEFTYLVDHD